MCIRDRLRGMSFGWHSMWPRSVSYTHLDVYKRQGTDWTYIEIPFSDIGNPTTFDQITFQESGNFGGNTILIDDMGFVLK